MANGKSHYGRARKDIVSSIIDKVVRELRCQQRKRGGLQQISADGTDMPR